MNTPDEPVTRFEAAFQEAAVLEGQPQMRVCQVGARRRGVTPVVEGFGQLPDGYPDR